MSATKAAAAPSVAEQTQASGAAASPLPLGVAQRLGNEQLQMLLRARLLQAKLTVSHPQDSFEQEADRVADQVMRMPGSSSHVAEHSVTVVQRSADASADVPTVDTATENSIRALSSRGSALPESVRSFMEPRFNADFRGVRVHHDAEAHELARGVSAQAFTVGRNVVFGAGHYAPETESGKRLARPRAHTRRPTDRGRGRSHRRGWEFGHSPIAAYEGLEGVEGAGQTCGRQRLSYYPQYIEPGSANQLASKALDIAGWINKHAAQQQPYRFRFVIVTDGVYVYSNEGTLEKTFKLLAPPPILGVYVTGVNDTKTDFETFRGMLDKDGRRDFQPIGGWDVKSHVLLSQWSTMTPDDQAKYLSGGLIMFLVPGHPARPAAPKRPKTPMPDVTLNPDATPSADATPGKGAGKSAEDLHKPTSGSEFDEQEGDKVANDRAFPAFMSMSSALVASGSNELTMNLDWTYGDIGMVDSVWDASTEVSYYWERWDVSNLSEFTGKGRDDAATKLQQNKRSASRRTTDQYLEHRAMQRVDALVEDVRNSRATIKSGGTPGNSDAERADEVPGRTQQLRARTGVGDCLRRRLSRGEHHAPAHETRQRDHAALPGGGDVFHPLYRLAKAARQTAKALERGIRGHRSAVGRVHRAKHTCRAGRGHRLAQSRTRSGTEPWLTDALDEKINKLQAKAHGSAVDALEIAVSERQLELESATGAKRERLKKEIKTLSKQLDNARANEESIAPNPDGTTLKHALRPEAALASEETDGTFPLMLQLVPLSYGKRKRWADLRRQPQGRRARWRGSHRRGRHQEGVQGIRRAQTEYGRGTVIMHIPDAIQNVSQRNLTERNVRVGGTLTKDRLHDLVSVLMVASLVFAPVGAVAMVVVRRCPPSASSTGGSAAMWNSTRRSPAMFSRCWAARRRWAGRSPDCASRDAGSIRDRASERRHGGDRVYTERDERSLRRRASGRGGEQNRVVRWNGVVREAIGRPESGHQRRRENRFAHPRAGAQRPGKPFSTRFRPS